MSDDKADEPREVVSNAEKKDLQASAISSNFKILGYNTTGSGITYGVLGQVDSPDGYGLGTPNDVRIEGIVDTAETDFVVQAGTTATSAATNFVAGHSANRAADGVVGGTIAGGGYDDGSTHEPNIVHDNYGTIGGGGDNEAGDGSDEDPTASEFATVGGGKGNVASARGATVGGGIGNEASVSMATVGGGGENTASDQFATVAGGTQNIAEGAMSYVAGFKAKAKHDGAVVFGDSTLDSISSQQQNEARFQMPIYAPDFSVTSTRAAKTDIEPVNSKEVLAGVESLDVSTWKFTDYESGRHMGPMAEDFDETFGLGTDGKHISNVNAIGVAFAALQGLSAELTEAEEKVEAKTERIAELENRLDKMGERLTRLETDRTSTATDD